MAGIKPSKEHILLSLILLVSFYLRTLNINGGLVFSEDLHNILNVSTISIWGWIDPDTYTNPLYHGPLYALIIAFISNIIFLPAILSSGAPFPLNNDILQWEHSTGVFIIEPLFRGAVVLLSLLTIFLVYRIGKEYGNNNGLISAFLLGTLSWYLIINFFTAPYTAVTLAISLSLFLFYYGIKNNEYNIIFISSMIAALSVYLTILALIIPFICLLFLFISRRINQLPKKAIKLYGIILLIPPFLVVSIGGLRWAYGEFLGTIPNNQDFVNGTSIRWAYGEFLGTILDATVKWTPTWFQLWDPINGVFLSVEQPLIYLDIFLDFLSPIFILFCIIGIVLCVHNIKNNQKSRDIDILILSWFFVGLILLNILNAKTTRYPTILFPPLTIFAANGLIWISEKAAGLKSKIFKYSLISILMISAVYSQPHLDNYINDEYIIVTEDASSIIDPKIIADYINPNITTNDTVLSDIQGYPWWYIKGNFSGDNTLNYWKKPDSNYVVIEQYAKEIDGSGGGPVWLEGNFGTGKIILVSFNITEKADILNKITYGKNAGIVFADNKVKTVFKNIRIPVEILGEEPFDEFLIKHNLIIINSPAVKNRLFLKERKTQIINYLENGGTILILNPKIRYIDWLPIETKVATQINDYYTHRETTPQNKIYLTEDQSEIAVNWTGIFFDYDKNYKEIALNSPVAMTLYNNYTMEKIIRTPQQNWPLFYIYKKRV